MQPIGSITILFVIVSIGSIITVGCVAIIALGSAGAFTKSKSSATTKATTLTNTTTSSTTPIITSSETTTTTTSSDTTPTTTSSVTTSTTTTTDTTSTSATTNAKAVLVDRSIIEKTASDNINKLPLLNKLGIRRRYANQN